MRARWPPACHVDWVTAVGLLMATAVLDYKLLLRAWQEWGCYVGLDRGQSRRASHSGRARLVGQPSVSKQNENRVMYSVALSNSGSSNALSWGGWQAYKEINKPTSRKATHDNYHLPS